MQLTATYRPLCETPSLHTKQSLEITFINGDLMKSAQSNSYRPMTVKFPYYFTLRLHSDFLDGQFHGNFKSYLKVLSHSLIQRLRAWACLGDSIITMAKLLLHMYLLSNCITWYMYKHVLGSKQQVMIPLALCLGPWDSSIVRHFTRLIQTVNLPNSSPSHQPSTEAWSNVATALQKLFG